MLVSCQDCKHKDATQLAPFPMCDRCWAARFSTQYIGGEDIPFLQWHKQRLIGLNLWRKDGESNEDWGKRCKQYTQENQRTL